MKLSTPPALTPGDTIAIIATAKAMESGQVDRAKQTFESWGLQVALGKHLFAREHQFAGTDAQRLADLQSALDDPSIQAVICARGGYGTTRFVDQIDWSKFQQNPKWLCGFSDITVLLQKINNLGFEALHGPMPIFFNLGITEHSKQHLQNILFNKPVKYDLPANQFNQLGSAEGILTGGNLAMICDSIGTDTEVQTEGKILFLEEITEYLYRMDRMMVHLERAGKLQNLKGIIAGQFTSMEDNPIPFGKNAEEIILDHCAKYKFPILCGFPGGHEQDNFTLPMGRRIKMKVGEHGSEVIL